MKCHRNPMHVKNLKTKWAHLTRCQQRIESYVTELCVSFLFHFNCCCWHYSRRGPGWRGGDNWPTPPRSPGPRLKRYWADTKVTMCSRQVWAVRGDRNWEMCSVFTHHSEGSQGPPACFELAGSTHSVAFAFHLHCALQKLKKLKCLC